MAHHTHTPCSGCTCTPAAGHHPEPGEFDEDDETAGESRVTIEPRPARQEGDPCPKTSGPTADRK